MKELTVTAALENLDAVKGFVHAELDALRCPADAAMQLNIAVDELFSNVARYAYHPGKGDVTVRIESLDTPPAVQITFFDSGKPYDPLSKPAPDITLGAKERTVGGLGIFLVKQLMDDVRYTYRDGRNILQIEKKL